MPDNERFRAWAASLHGRLRPRREEEARCPQGLPLRVPGIGRGGGAAASSERFVEHEASPPRRGAVQVRVHGGGEEVQPRVPVSVGGGGEGRGREGRDGVQGPGHGPVPVEAREERVRGFQGFEGFRESLRRVGPESGGGEGEGEVGGRG